MRATGNEMPGVINHSVVCGGVRVRAGDLVLGDDDRMVVVPRDQAEGCWGLARRFSARDSRCEEEEA